MNIKKKSIIIPAFALLIGASLAGSISGTVAWYQYSTRVQTAYVGVSGGKSGNLQISLDNGSTWHSRLTYTDIDNYLQTNAIGQKLIPVTSGDMGKDDELPTKLYSNPIVGRAAYDDWEQAVANNYVSIPLRVRYVERTKDGNQDYLAKKLYLSDITIQKDTAINVQNADQLNISEAVRVHVDCGGLRHLISLNGGETLTNGKLDLDADTHADKAYDGSDKRYGFDGGTLEEITYGEGKQTSYSKADLVVTPNDDLSLTGATPEKVIGETKADANGVDMTLTIWVEGWHAFDETADYPSLWNSKYIDASFDVGLEFAVNPEE